MQDEFIQLEKQSANKKGLIILIILIIACLGLGGYLIYTKTDILSKINLPWKKDNQDKTEEKEVVIDKTPISNNTESLHIPELDDQNIIINNSLTLHPISLSGDNKGYTFNLQLSNSDQENNSDIKCERILIDGYDTTAKFEASIRPQSSEEVSFSIKKSELDEIEINNFGRIMLCLKIDDSEEINRVSFSTSSLFKINNDKKDVTLISQINDIYLYYYKELTDSKYTYIYFYIDNKTPVELHNIHLNFISINDEIYDYGDLNVETYTFSKKIFYLKIPKKKYKEIDNVLLSFFICEENKDVSKIKTYITSKYMIRL